jgi:hypothetical protein
MSQFLFYFNMMWSQGVLGFETKEDEQMKGIVMKS